MYEKVNPSHPDKIADRIAGAIVDLAYSKEENPKAAVEVLIGHGACLVIVESSVNISSVEVGKIVRRISGENIEPCLVCVPQDQYLASNQAEDIRCGDNGIFKGMPVTEEQKKLSGIARKVYAAFPYDGKYIIDEQNRNIVFCQSHATISEIYHVVAGDVVGMLSKYNPIGDWTGGVNVDSGATNRKLGSDMGDAVTGGGLHGKDLSKADVSVNIYAHLLAQKTGKPVELHCAIGDKKVGGVPYAEIVKTAREYIRQCGGFEKFAEWGLI